MSNVVVKVGPAPPTTPKPEAKAPKRSKALKDRQSARELELTREVTMLRTTMRRLDKEADGHREQIRHLEADVVSYQQREATQEHQVMIAFLNEQLGRRDAEIVKLHNTIKSNEETFKKELERIAYEYESRIEELEDVLTRKQYELTHITSEVEQLRQFKESKQFIVDELASLKQRMKDTKRTHGAMMEQHEAKVKAEMERLSAAYQERIDRLEDNARQMTLETLSVETRQIVRDNVRMAGELQVHYEQNTALVEALRETKERLRAVEHERALLVRRNRMRLYAVPQEPPTKDPTPIGPTPPVTTTVKLPASTDAAAQRAEEAMRTADAFMSRSSLIIPSI